MKFSKLIALFLSVIVFSSSVRAAVNAPRAGNGDPLPTIDWIGADTAQLDAANTTLPTVIATGSAIVYGIIVSSVQFGSYMIFRDSGTANVQSATSTIIFHSSQAVSVPAGNAGSNLTHYYKFPVPIKFNNGVCVNLSATVGSSGGVGTWTVLLRQRSVPNSGARAE